MSVCNTESYRTAGKCLTFCPKRFGKLFHCWKSWLCICVSPKSQNLTLDGLREFVPLHLPTASDKILVLCLDFYAEDAVPLQCRLLKATLKTWDIVRPTHLYSLKYFFNFIILAGEDVLCHNSRRATSRTSFSRGNSTLLLVYSWVEFAHYSTQPPTIIQRHPIQWELVLVLRLYTSQDGPVRAWYTRTIFAACAGIVLHPRTKSND